MKSHLHFTVPVAFRGHYIAFHHFSSIYVFIFTSIPPISFIKTLYSQFFLSFEILSLLLPFIKFPFTPIFPLFPFPILLISCNHDLEILIRRLIKTNYCIRYPQLVRRYLVVVVSQVTCTLIWPQYTR